MSDTLAQLREKFVNDLYVSKGLEAVIDEAS